MPFCAHGLYITIKGEKKFLLSQVKVLFFFFKKKEKVTLDAENLENAS